MDSDTQTDPISIRSADIETQTDPITSHSVDIKTQTDPISIHSVDIETEDKTSFNGSCQTLMDIANDIDKLYEDQIFDDRHSVQSVNHSNTSVGSTTQQKVIIPECPLATPVQLFQFHQNSNAPYQSIPGKPFADFSASELVKSMDFLKINEREVKYFGDCKYSYGNSSHQPCPIPQDSYLYQVVKRVKSLYPTQSFNSVLVTKFIDGNSFLPLHSDNEAEIVEDSLILTVSLGAGRTVNFQKINGSHTKGLQTSHGDVYVMSAKSQAKYRHGVPKDFSKRMRVSLTFRHLKTSPDSSLELTESQKSIADFLVNLNSSPEPSPVNTESGQCVDTLFISSSMFRNLKDTELRSSEHSSKVLYYPGATAGGILKRLKEDPSLQQIVTKDIKKVFILCGSNNVDQILNVPRNMNKSINIDCSNFSKQKYDKTLVEMEHLTSYLRDLFEHAELNVLNILPRASYVRNRVINDLNGFLHHLCAKQGYKFIDTVLDRYLFSNRQGYRRCEFFHVSGSDNVHLNSAGVVKLGKLLKFLMHRQVGYDSLS